MPNVKINRMEIFRVGKHNGIDFTEEDLFKIERNFRELQGSLTPKLKITHREDQESLAGLASYGNLVNVYTEKVDGEWRLFANLEDVPEQVAQWIREGRFSERSIEMYLKTEIGGKKYENVLTGVALLGHEIPAVPGMGKVVAGSGAQVIDIRDAGKVPQGATAVGFAFDYKTINFKTQEANKMPEEILKLQNQNKELEEKIKALEFKMKDNAHAGEIETFKKQVAELQSKIAENNDLKAKFESAVAENKKLAEEKAEMAKKIEAQEKKEAEFAKKAKTDKVDAMFDKFKKAGKIVPAIEKQFKELCMSLDDTQAVAKFKQMVEGKEVEIGFSQLALLATVLEKMPKVVNFGEVSTTVGEGGTQVTEPKLVTYGKDTFETQNDELADRAKEIQAEKKCTYEKALELASKEQKQAVQS